MTSPRPQPAQPRTVGARLPPTVVDPWLTVPQVAWELGVSRMTVYRLIADGALRHMTMRRAQGRGAMRVRRSWVEAFIRANTAGGAP